jgi:flagellar basal-body rod protein FlgG
MDSGIYVAISGALSAQDRIDVLSSNLANVNTIGFKRDRYSFESVLAAVNNPSPADDTLTDTPAMPRMIFRTDFTAGSSRQSGNPLDLTLDGDGFFVVNGPQGRAYTRQGNFHLDAAGKLVNADGFEVQGTAGPVIIQGGRVEIDRKGAVSVDGNPVANLAVVDFPKPYALQKAGGSLFTTNGTDVAEQPVTATNVLQGTIEESNVNAIMEMTLLMDGTRNYESCLKAMRMYDDMAAKAANEIGKL